ncbi:hypothetical protein CT171_05825 [Trueperella pyogenes]|uniref:hypothetical protein n=1 Tax=Trueperella pyogenes TaxID=1661 RepID=UPI000C1B6D56|nr:hypothetical protein [Trueperella pyogenes]PIN51231.1 hypothetical protein CT171_05825 [Trueperella pyogenes]
MHSFFTDPATHIGPEGQLHVWAMAKAEVRSALAPFAQACAGFDCLGIQPLSALHATVLRLAPPDGDVAAFCAAFRRECEGLGELHLPVQWPVVMEDSVICVGPKTPQWDRLICATERASIQAFGDEAAPYNPPFGPHLTVAYGVCDGIDEPIITALQHVREHVPEEARQVRPKDDAEDVATDRGQLCVLDIDSVVLVRVYQDRQAGTYTCDVLAEVSWA